MGRALERLGRICHRHRLWVLALWAFAVIGLLGVASVLGTRTSDDLSLPGTDAQRAARILEREFPSQQDASGTLVYAAAGGRADAPARRAAIEAALARVARTPGVASVGSPFGPGLGAGLSRDGRVAYATVTLGVAPVDVTHAEAAAVVEAAGVPAASGLELAVGGTVGSRADPPAGDHSEAIGLALAVIILLVAFGSVVAMGLPILTALAGLATGLSIVTIAGHLVVIPSIGPTLGIMIGLGVGIDYALFLVMRQRANLAAGLRVGDAVAHTTATAGAAVVFAGGTVIIALLALALAGIPIVAALGYTAAIMVAVAVAAAVTLLPAVLSLLGPHVNAWRVPGLHRRGGGPEHAHGWARWAEGVARRPRTALVAGLLVLVALAAPAAMLDLGQSDAGTDPPGSQTRRAFDLMSAGFGPGSNGPLLVAVEGDDRDGLARLWAALATAPGVEAVAPPVAGPGGRAALISVVPATAPASEATQRLVRHLRADVVAPALAGTGLVAYVGGQTAAGIDLAGEITDALPVVILTVIGLSMLMLFLAFRSLLVPLKAALMNLLSIAAAYGVVTAVFQEGWGGGLIGLEGPVPIVSFVPLLMFAILFGLSMDYEVFLLSRIRESWRGSGDARAAVIEGIGSTGRVITAAALIMVGVFGSFVLHDDPVIQQFGLGMAVAVAVDATIVRCLVVPATMLLLGRRAWWLPAWLERRVPHMEIEAPAAPGLATAATRADTPTRG